MINARMQNFMANKKENDLFKRKVSIIKRHFKNAQHPLRILADLFADELEKLHKRHMKTQQKTNITQDGASQLFEDLTRSQLQPRNQRTIIKLSEREQESDNMKELKIKSQYALVVRFKQLQQIVKDFTLLLKHAIIRFYQIQYNSLRAFHKNYFSEKIKNLVLGYKVSKALHASAADAHRDDIKDFSKAMNSMQQSDLEFFQVPALFHLDEKYYLREQRDKNREAPVNVIVQQSMDNSAFKFRANKQNVNKSQIH